MKDTNRRLFLTNAAAVSALMAAPAGAQTAGGASRKVHYANGKKPAKPPLFNQAVSYGNLVFIAGQGAHFKGDIKAHTEHVLNQLKERLELAGSSMDKVLKVNVYLNTLDDYKGMNEVFMNKFGAEPPVRTTIAANGGIPGDSLVEIDCIAYV